MNLEIHYADEAGALEISHRNWVRIRFADEVPA